MRHMSRRTLTIAIALAVLRCGLSAPALAVDRDWVNGSGGFFQTTTNWDPIGVPNAADRAIFDLNGTYTVSFIGSRTNSRLLVSDGDVTFDLNAATYTLSNTGSTSLIVGEALRGIGAAGRLTIADGTASAVGGEIGRIGLIGGGGSGTVAVTTGGTLRFSSLLAVGSTRSGTLLVNNGADLITGSITSIGLDGAGAVAVSGPGSSWMSTSWIDVAGNAPGTISITGGGTVSDSFATVGANNVALAVVDGAGSRWTHAGNFRVGEFGSAVATLNITNGGFVTQTVSGALGIIGDQFGSRGTVNVDGNGSRWTNTGGQLQVGYIGNATLNISNGALVSSFSNDVSVGHSGGSTGVVTIGGAGTFAATLSGRSVYVGGNPTGDGGTGSITINPGGHVQASNSGLVKLWPGGRIDLAGGMLQGGSFQLAGGSLNWSSGTLYI